MITQYHLRSTTDPTAIAMLLSLARRPLAWASAAPLLCAVHCAATPILVLAAPTLAPTPAVERMMLGGTALLAAVAWWYGYRRHRRILPALPILLGLMVWAGALLFLGTGSSEVIGSGAGSVMVAAGLLWNAWLRHRVVCRNCRAHDHAATQVTHLP
jgi:hypothetical protein